MEKLLRLGNEKKNLSFPFAFHSTFRNFVPEFIDTAL